MGGKVGLDANVFLCILLPEATKADKENIEGSEAIIEALTKKKIQSVTSSIALSELAWAFLREEKPIKEMEGGRYVLEEMLKESLEIIPVNNNIAWQAGKLRRKYYTKENMISYQDAIYLATCLNQTAKPLYTTDPHLLITEEIKVLEPKNFKIE